MFDAAIKALTQMFSPPFRRVLLKSIGLGLVLIVLMGIGLNRLFSWIATTGATWAEATAGGHTVWQILAWVLSIAATLGIITGALFLMPAATAFVGSFFVDAGLGRDGLARPFAEIRDQAFLAQRTARQADVATVQDQPMMRMHHVFFRDDLEQLELHRQWVLAGRQPGAIADPEDMRVHRHG